MLILLLILPLLLHPTTTATATLSTVPNVNSLANPLLFLNFTQPTILPSFQLFTNSAQINYTVVSTTATPQSSFMINSSVGLVAEQVTLIFNNPQSVCNGTLSLSSYILTLSVLQAGVSVQNWGFLMYSVLVLIMCFYGKAGLMLVEFTQVTMVANSSTMIFQSLRKEMYKWMYFLWGAPWFEGISSYCFLNNALVIMAMLAVAGLSSGLVRYLLGQGAGNYPKIKYLFNYNLLLLVGIITYLPLCVSIVFDYADLIDGGSPVSFLMILSHILSTIFLILTLISVYQIGLLLNRKYHQTNPTFYRCFSKLFAELDLKHWYRRNQRLNHMIKLMVIAIGFYWQSHVFYIVMLQALEMFLVFTISPYKRPLYNRFKTVISITILIEYIVNSVEVMFQYMSPTLLEYSGTVKLDMTSMALFAGNSLAFVGLGMYEAYERLRAWNCGRNSKEDEDEEGGEIEMVETNRMAKQSLVTNENQQELEEKVA